MCDREGEWEWVERETMCEREGEWELVEQETMCDRESEWERVEWRQCTSTGREREGEGN